MRIGFIGSPKTFGKKDKIAKALTRLKEKDPSCAIITGGNEHGFEADVKHYALMFKMDYAEYNPLYTPQNEYSIPVAGKDYGVPYQSNYDFARYVRLLNVVDVIVFGYEETNMVEQIYSNILKKAQKLNKKIIIL